MDNRNAQENSQYEKLKLKTEKVLLKIKLLLILMTKRNEND